MKQELKEALRSKGTKRVSTYIEEGVHPAVFIAAVETEKGIEVHLEINNIQVVQRYSDLSMYDRDIVRYGRQVNITGNVNTEDLWDKTVNVRAVYNGDFLNVYPYSATDNTSGLLRPTTNVIK